MVVRRIAALDAMDAFEVGSPTAVAAVGLVVGLRI